MFLDRYRFLGNETRSTNFHGHQQPAALGRVRKAGGRVASEAKASDGIPLTLSEATTHHPSQR
jgi:hypothetical protein